MQQNPQQVLKKYFGYDSFRPLQEDIITAALDGKDVLALMPTGGGKSLCYQIPGLSKEGLCLVISPLIALMNDQVQNLRKKNITAFSIYSGMPRYEVVNVLETAIHSNCKFLYVSPERLESALFKEFLPGLDVNFIAVDEAHCISQWGYDFRPPYLKISELRKELPGVPLIALTASATPLVQQDICAKLSLNADNNFTVFKQSFERPNLSYSIFNVQSRINKIIDVLTNVSGSAIVYCKTRKRTKEITDVLQMQGISADYYNAGLSTEIRTKKQQAWLQNKTRVMVCTNAFGMGIDKPDVRTVIHADVPDCLENYYQEAGRAGRDGQKAFAVLLYDNIEIEALKSLPDIRYPNAEIIRNVYSSVVNYLQLPDGEEPGNYYDFDLKDFIKRFKLDIHTTIYGLKALEQDGWLNFNEQVFIPATVRFTIFKNSLYEYEAANPHLEPIIKTLLRTYEGIYDYPVAISETFVAYILKQEAVFIKEQLRRLHFDSVIDYQPQKDTPQVYLNRTRIKSSLLEIDRKFLEERKKIFTERVCKMIDFISNKQLCRSKMIGNYFGDAAMKDCGICDNCLSKKKAEISKEDFNSIQKILKENLQIPQEAAAMLNLLKRFKKEHAWAVINFLVEEGNIKMQPDGKLQWA
ncbi:MAG: ATP-dependent DNA helicase RecQ [Niabella sp.]